MSGAATPADACLSNTLLPARHPDEGRICLCTTHPSRAPPRDPEPPLAQILLSTRGYYEIASLIRQLADELCEGHRIYALEGGYDLTAIAWSARACVDTLLGNPFAEDPLGPAPAVPGPDIEPLLAEVKRLHAL